MRAIVVQNPWAWALVVDDPDRKNVENRTFKIAPGELVIVAGKRWSFRGAQDPVLSALWYKRTRQWGFASGPGAWIPSVEKGGFHEALRFGAAIGSVNVLDCHEAAPGCCDSPWAETSYVEHGGRVRTRLWHWVTAQRAHFVEPIPVRGRQGIFNVELSGVSA